MDRGRLPRKPRRQQCFVTRHPRPTLVPTLTKRTCGRNADATNQLPRYSLSCRRILSERICTVHLEAMELDWKVSGMLRGLRSETVTCSWGQHFVINAPSTYPNLEVCLRDVLYFEIPVLRQCLLLGGEEECVFCRGGKMSGSREIDGVII